MVTHHYTCYRICRKEVKYLPTFCPSQAEYQGPDPRSSYAGVSIDTPHNFSVAPAYLCFVSTKQDTPEAGLDPTGVRLSTPSDLRCIFTLAARWRFCRFPRRVCKLARYGDPQTYVRLAHFFTLGFFRRIVTPAI